MSFSECSERSKRRKITSICNTYESSLIQKASEKYSKIKCNNSDRDSALFNGALAMFMDLKLSRSKYEDLRSYNEMMLGAKFYPPYQKILEGEKDCYPEEITVDEKGASVRLQSLLNHTSKRILLSLEIRGDNETQYELIGKWGMDGSTGQQIFNQKWQNEEYLEYVDEKSVFMISFVPLQLVSIRSEKVIWKNERPSSIRYCRPIQFEFVKENKENVDKEYRNICEQIQNLSPTEVELKNSVKVVIKYKLLCTMVDGKVVNILTNQASSRSCNICKAKPKDMNNLSYVRSIKPDEQKYNFGLSTLHCWMRFMECLLHISYNLDFKKTSASKENVFLKETKKNLSRLNLEKFWEYV